MPLRPVLGLLLLSAAAALPQKLGSEHCLLGRGHKLLRGEAKNCTVKAAGKAPPGGCSPTSAACPSCGRKEGSCVLWGDPHVYVFDGKVHLRILEHGDFWVVRSPCVGIQARYGKGPMNATAVIRSMAISGGFIQDHVLLIEPSEGQVTWDGQSILASFPSSFAVDGLLSATYDGEGEHADPGLRGLESRSVRLELPLGIRLTVNRWPGHLDVILTMRPLPGMDGHCGNFNGDPEDDSLEAMRARGLVGQIKREQRLLPGSGAPAPSSKVSPLDCAADRRSRAVRLCNRSLGQDSQGLREDCVFDVCFGGADFARQEAVLEKQMLRSLQTLRTTNCRCRPGQQVPTTTTTTTTLGEIVSCLIWGDPHIVTFDMMRLVREDFWSQKYTHWDRRGERGVSGHVNADVYEAGVYWIVQSPLMEIQGFYGNAGGLQIHSIAFGGKFMQGHFLTIDEMYTGQCRVMWDGHDVHIRPNRGESLGDGLVLLEMTLESQRGEEFERIKLRLPESVEFEVDRYSYGPGAVLAAYLRLRKHPGMDGQCGRGEGLFTEDEPGYFMSNWGQRVPVDEVLFGGSSIALFQDARPAANGAAEVCARSRPLPEAQEACTAGLQGVDSALGEALLQGCLIDVCANGMAVAGVTKRMAERVQELLEAEGPRKGWYSAGPWNSCDDSCSAVGLICSEEELHAHNADVDTGTKVLDMIAFLNGKGAFQGPCLPGANESEDVPSWSRTHCYSSSPGRALSTYNCAARPAGGLEPKYRLCYCHAPALPGTDEEEMEDLANETDLEEWANETELTER